VSFSAIKLIGPECLEIAAGMAAGQATPVAARVTKGNAEPGGRDPRLAPDAAGNLQIGGAAPM
jgi:hypothetical protein